MYENTPPDADNLDIDKFPWFNVHHVKDRHLKTSYTLTEEDDPELARIRSEVTDWSTLTNMFGNIFSGNFAPGFDDGPTIVNPPPIHDATSSQPITTDAIQDQQESFSQMSLEETPPEAHAIKRGAEEPTTFSKKQKNTNPDEIFEESIMQDEQQDDISEQSPNLLQDSQSDKYGIIIRTPPIMAKWDVSNFLDNIEFEDDVTVTFCNFREWTHCFLLCGSAATISLLDTILADEYILGHTFYHMPLTSNDWPFIQNGKEISATEALATHNTIQQLKENCPPDQYDNLATILTNSSTVSEVLSNFFNMMAQQPDGTAQHP